MTPKQKALDLYDQYLDLARWHSEDDGDGSLTTLKNNAKACALIVVKEIDKAIDFDWMEVQNLESEHRYWEEVKQEIERI